MITNGLLLVGCFICWVHNQAEGGYIPICSQWFYFSFVY